MRPRIMILADRAAPMLTALVLCWMLVYGMLDTLRPAGVEPYFEQVAAAIDRMPNKIGDFVGTPVEVTPSAIRLLRPNRLLQRVYLDPWTGRRLTLLVVHCGNVRDMGGHYPPNCYPAHGWRMERMDDAGVTIGGAAAPAAMYEFSKREGAGEARMHVLNFFVLPSHKAGVVADISAVDSARVTRRTAGLGAAQVQMVANDRDLLTDPEVVDAFMRAIEPAVSEILKGPTRE